MDFENMLTEEEREWVAELLKKKEDNHYLLPSQSYFYIKKTEAERNKNRHKTRKILDALRKELPKYTPQQLYGLRSSANKPNDFPGIYIIYNSYRRMYYIGQSKTVFSRSYKHFTKNKGNAEVFRDYNAGQKFLISLIPIDSTPFTTLNELEDNAIRAYDSFENGYNLIYGNINDRPNFSDADHEMVANFLMEKIKYLDVFLTLTNDRKRMNFVMSMIKGLNIPYDGGFAINFRKFIKAVQKEMKDG